MIRGQEHSDSGGVTYSPELAAALLETEILPTDWCDLPGYRARTRAEKPTPDSLLVDTRFLADAPIPMWVSSPVAKGSVGLLYWIHGGGLVAGSPIDEIPLARRLADRLAISVITPQYRLAPEYQFPAAIDDCVSGLGWLREAPDIDCSSLMIGGRSAGGGLAATLATREADETPIEALALLYPMLDPANNSKAPDPVWSGADLRRAWAAYLGGVDPALVTLVDDADLSHLPPTFLAVAEHDPLAPDGRALNDRLKRFGIATEIWEAPGAFHAWDRIAPASGLALELEDRLVRFLAAHTER